MKRSYTTMILIPDSDDDKLEDANKNPLLTEAQKEDFRKEWAYEKSVLELQGGRHAWPEPRINEAIRCVTKEHGDQCQGLMSSCNLQLVADLDCLHEDAAKQKDLQEGGAFKKHQEPEDLQGGPVSEAGAEEGSSSISSNGSQLHAFCDASQLPEYEEATLPDFCDETQVPHFCDTSQLLEYEEATLPDFCDETQVPDSCDGAQLDVFNETQPDV